VWFSDRRSPSPPGGHAMVLSVAACCVRPTAHSLLCIVNGDDSAVFRFFSCLWWPWPLTFDLDIRTRERFLYNAPNRQVSSPYLNRSEGIVRTNKHTEKLDSMRWFSHRRYRVTACLLWRDNSDRVVCCCLLRTAYGARGACIVNRDDTAVFRFLSVVLVTLTFDLDIRTWTRVLYNTPNRQISSP